MNIISRAGRSIMSGAKKLGEAVGIYKGKKVSTASKENQPTKRATEKSFFAKLRMKLLGDWFTEKSARRKTPKGVRTQEQRAKVYRLKQEIKMAKQDLDNLLDTSASISDDAEVEARTKIFAAETALITYQKDLPPAQPRTPEQKDQIFKLDTNLQLRKKNLQEAKAKSAATEEIQMAATEEIQMAATEEIQMLEGQVKGAQDALDLFLKTVD